MVEKLGEDDFTGDGYWHLERMRDDGFWLGVEDDDGEMKHFDLDVEDGEIVLRERDG